MLSEPPLLPLYGEEKCNKLQRTPLNFSIFYQKTKLVFADRTEVSLREGS